MRLKRTKEGENRTHA